MIKNSPASEGDTRGKRCRFTPWVRKTLWRRHLWRRILQYSCLGKSMDRGAWWDTVHRVAKESDTTEPLTNNNPYRGHRRRRGTRAVSAGESPKPDPKTRAWGHAFQWGVSPGKKSDGGRRWKSTEGCVSEWVNSEGNWGLILLEIFQATVWYLSQSVGMVLPEDREAAVCTTSIPTGWRLPVRVWMPGSFSCACPAGGAERPEAQAGSPCAGSTHCSCSGPGGSGRALAVCYGCHCGCQASPRRQHSLQRLIPHHGAFV